MCKVSFPPTSRGVQSLAPLAHLGRMEASPGELDATGQLLDQQADFFEQQCFGGESTDQGPDQDRPEGPALKTRVTQEFPDRREERRHTGVIKWALEKGVPDVGGLGWRSRTGHLLKNQAFYSSRDGQNDWDNPSHAGPKTWRAYHGPKLRADAGLMQRLDELEREQCGWEVKKAFVNTVRAQTLDRFYQQKLVNQQKEAAQTWAPHRRAKREIHKLFESCTADLDSMPMKELKKVLTPSVLHGDRTAIRNITKRVQIEETWKAAWKEMETMRHADTRAGFEHRTMYNAMLMELAGQPPRPFDPQRKIPNNCTSRLEELALPVEHKPLSDITKSGDYAGLYHVDHRQALESRFPGCGHELSTQFAAAVTETAKPGWPPPEQPPTPHPPLSDRGGGLKEHSVRSLPPPLSQPRMRGVIKRQDVNTLARHAVGQFLRTEAPPQPEQGNSLLKESVHNDYMHMSTDSSPRADHTTSSFGMQDQLDVAPPQRPVVYPVLVPTAESMTRREPWRPKQRPVSARVKRRAAPPAGRAAANQAPEIPDFGADSPEV